MSIDKFELTPALMHQFYKDILVNTGGNQQETLTEETPEKIAYLGENARQILVISNDANHAFLPEEEMDLLTGILTACDLTLADIALLNCARQKDITYEKLVLQFQPALVVMFGVSPDQLSFPLQFPMYQLQKYTGKTFLYAASLTTLSEDVNQKKRLWACLQRYFFDK